MNKEDWPSTPKVAVIVAGIVIVTPLLCWVLFWGIAHLLPAIGVMIGLAVAVSTTGLATAGAVASWTVPVASVALAVAGGSALVVVLVKAGKEAASEPFEWLVPLLGILGGLMLDVAKEFGIHNEMVKIAVTTVIAFLVVVAGACWKSPNTSWKLVAVFLLIIPPAAILVREIDASAASRLSEALYSIPPGVWSRLGFFAAIGIFIGILHALLHRSHKG